MHITFQNNPMHFMPSKQNNKKLILCGDLECVNDIENDHIFKR